MRQIVAILLIDSHSSPPSVRISDSSDVPFGKMTLGYAPPEQCRNLKPK